MSVLQLAIRMSDLIFRVTLLVRSVDINIVPDVLNVRFLKESLIKESKEKRRCLL